MFGAFTLLGLLVVEAMAQSPFTDDPKGVAGGCAGEACRRGSSCGESSSSKDEAPWMKIAKAEIGQAEREGESDNNPRILEYLATTGEFRTDETPWCSAFANWAMIKVGEKGTNSAVARSWLKWGEAIEEPRYGCLVVFKRGNSEWQGHVGFYVKSEGDNIFVLGGNQSNTVSIAPRSKADLLGYRWPTSKG